MYSCFPLDNKRENLYLAYCTSNFKTLKLYKAKGQILKTMVKHH